MKVAVLFYSASLLALASRPSDAVWPPSTVIEESNAPKSAGETVQTASQTERTRVVIDKLSNDEKRLSDVLSDLQKDQSNLERVKAPANPAVENLKEGGSK